MRLLLPIALVLALLLGAAPMAAAAEKRPAPSQQTAGQREHRVTAPSRLFQLATPLQREAARPRLRRARVRRSGLSQLARGLTSPHWRATKAKAAPHALGHLRLTFDMFEAGELAR